MSRIPCKRIDKGTGPSGREVISYFKNRILLASLFDYKGKLKRFLRSRAQGSKRKVFRKGRVYSLYSKTKHANLDKYLIFKLRKSIGA